MFGLVSWMGSHPQKFMLKKVCKLIYGVGLGDCWYEETPRSRYRKILYKVWTVISHIFFILFIIDECVAFFSPNLTFKEKNDLKQFFVGHIAIYAKVVVFYIYNSRIQLVLKKLVDDNRDVHSSIDIDKSSVKKAMVYCISLTVMIYLSVGGATLLGVTTYFNTGIPVRTGVTYYPPTNLTGTYINILRCLVELQYYYAVTIMIALDSLSYCSLIFLEHKFKLLQSYFLNLRIMFLENREDKSQDELEEELKQGFVMGIHLHENALWCARNIQSSLGNIYSIQVLQCTSLLVNCLIKLVTAERDMTFLLANVVLIVTMVLLAGSYMMSSGDITWEALNVSDAMFYCGWELCRNSSDLRKLAVVAIQRSQVPVQMTAFSVFTLSYANFLTLLRSSYSFFAVMY